MLVFYLAIVNRSITSLSLLVGTTVSILFSLCLLKSNLFTFQFDQFVVVDLQSVFNFDVLISSHPIYMT